MLHKEFISRQFLVFLAVGGFAALVNFVSRILYNTWLSYEWAVFLAYLTGMMTAYALSRYFVFGPSDRSKMVEIYRFAIVNLVAVIQVWGISVGLARYIFPLMAFDYYPYEIAHLIGLSMPIFTSYLGHKYFSFKGA